MFMWRSLPSRLRRSRFDANICLQEIKSLTQQDLFAEAVNAFIFFQFLPHFVDGNIVMRGLGADRFVEFLARHLELFGLRDPMEDKVRFQSMRGQRTSAL